MTILTEKELMICIPTTAPDEYREMLIKAIATMMRHYAQNPDKRKDDGDHMVVISDLLQELAETG